MPTSGNTGSGSTAQMGDRGTEHRPCEFLETVELSFPCYVWRHGWRGKSWPPDSWCCCLSRSEALSPDDHKACSQRETGAATHEIPTCPYHSCISDCCAASHPTLRSSSPHRNRC